jgi:TetR/AcrR family transcriptional regulator, multidrug resistance operon repressor
MRTRNENKIEQVRQKAIEMLVQEGLNGFSMQKLAKAANVSPATLYIYYKDKDDLIVRIGQQEGERMTAATLQGFNPALSFREGLKVQWINRSAFWMSNPLSYRLFELLRASPYNHQVFSSIQAQFGKIMGEFVHNAIRNKQLVDVPVEVYWSTAFAPLQNLIRFHHEGKSFGAAKFKLTDKLIWQTFDLVVKALTP